VSWLAVGHPDILKRVARQRNAQDGISVVVLARKIGNNGLRVGIGFTFGTLEIYRPRMMLWPMLIRWPIMRQLPEPG
jgi:hypothetical protein